MYIIHIHMHMYIYTTTHITYQHDANMINRSTLHLWEVGGGPLKLLRFQHQGFGPSTSKSWAKCARLRHKMGMGRKPEYKTIFIMYYTINSIYIYTHMYIIWYHSWVDEDHWPAILVIMRIQRVLIIAMSLSFGFDKKRVPCSLEQISKNSDETVDFILFQTLASDPRMRRWSCSCLKNSKGKRWQTPERFGEFGTEVSTTLSTTRINHKFQYLAVDFSCI